MKQDHSTIFRNEAWEAYRSKREQTVLPSLVAPPIFVFFWVLFVVLLGAGGIAWWTDVPIYTTGNGILQERPAADLEGAPAMVALIFVPASHPLTIHKGISIQLQIGDSGTENHGQIERVDPDPISPQEARKRYMLNGAAAMLITRPSIVVFARVTPPLSDHIYADSVVNAQIPIRTQHVLLLLFESSN